jgi:hypothetical protein
MKCHIYEADIWPSRQYRYVHSYVPEWIVVEGVFVDIVAAFVRQAKELGNLRAKAKTKAK